MMRHGWSAQPSQDLKMRCGSQWPRMNCHRFTTGFMSWHLGGSGTIRSAEPCHTASQLLRLHAADENERKAKAQFFSA
jgi:hypothetical protein